jgi:type IX secretion system PorP/SprF family membrane protein
MKRFYAFGFVVCMVAISFAAKAQHSIVYSQYLFNGLLINPAYAGSHVQLSASLTYRNQWVNFAGAPVTGTLGAHTSLLKGKIGVGMLATVDKIGSYTNTGLFGSYAYMIRDPVRKGVFSMGVSAGFNNYNADFSKLNLRNGQDITFAGFMSELKPNFGGGLFYYNPKLFAGISVPTILTHSELFNGPLEQLQIPRFYYLYGGVKIPLDPRTKKIILTPSLLFRVQDGTPLSTDFNLSVAFEELISLGTSYRSGDGAISYINFKLSEKFYVGYSYDWTVSDIRMYSQGTHEIMINYRTRLRNIHRDLDCPQFFSH